jgi:hypothetical protein
MWNAAIYCAAGAVVNSLLTIISKTAVLAAVGGATWKVY